MFVATLKKILLIREENPLSKENPNNKFNTKIVPQFLLFFKKKLRRN